MMNIADPGFRIREPLRLADNEVHVWRVDLDALAPGEAYWEGLLVEDERERARRFHFPRDRSRFTAGRGLLRTVLGGYLNSAPQDLRFRYSGKGKPTLNGAHAGSGLKFNISHSDMLALFAFTRRGNLGVDLEKVRRDFEVEAIAQRFFSSRERERLGALPAEQRHEAFFHCWTRKEAFIKAKGEGLSLPLHQFDVSLTPGEPATLLGTRPDASEASRWSMQDIDVGPGYAAALVVEGHDWRLKTWQSHTAR